MRKYEGMKWDKVKPGALVVKRLILLITIAVTIILSACAESDLGLDEAQQVPGADPQRGWQAIQDYGCHSCHTIPGVPSADSLVGPPLTAWADRHYIAGQLPNTAENLIEWIQYPQTIEPGTAMPNMDVTEQDARDISAYLYTLRRGGSEVGLFQD
jgi:cytochrome c